MKQLWQQARENAQPGEWKRAGIGAALALACGTAAAMLSGASPHAFVVNQTGVPLRIQIDNDESAVNFGQSLELKRGAKPGAHRVKVLAGEKLLSDEYVVAPPGSKVLVYNLLGMGLVVRSQIVYSNDKSKNPNDDQNAEVLPCTGFAYIDDVDYPFRAPPTSMSSKDTNARIVKTYAQLIAGDAQLAIVQSLVRHHDPARAQGILEARLRLPNAGVEAADAIAQFSRLTTGDDAEAGILLRALGGDAASAMNLRYFTFEAAKRDRCAYGRRVAAAVAPATAASELQALRGLHLREANAAIAALTTKYPQDALIRGTLARRALREGKFEECAKFTEEASGLALAEIADLRATCLYGAGRGTEAFALLGNVARGGTAYAKQAAIEFAAVFLAHERRASAPTPAAGARGVGSVAMGGAGAGKAAVGKAVVRKVTTPHAAASAQPYDVFGSAGADEPAGAVVAAPAAKSMATAKLDMGMGGLAGKSSATPFADVLGGVVFPRSARNPVESGGAYAHALLLDGIGPNGKAAVQVANGRRKVALRIGELQDASPDGDPAFDFALALAQAALLSPQAEREKFDLKQYKGAQFYLPSRLVVALALEDAREGHVERAKARIFATGGTAVPLEILVGFVLDGGDEDLLYGLRLEDYAAVLLVRSRQLASEGKTAAAEALHAQALAAEVVPGWVAKLAAHWPAPTPQGKLAPALQLARLTP